MASKEQELVLTRVFDAPRELVFKAWTDPKQVAQGGVPKGFLPGLRVGLTAWCRHPHSQARPRWHRLSNDGRSRDRQA